MLRIFAAAFLLVSVACDTPSEPVSAAPAALEGEQEQVNYSLGYRLGEDLQKRGFEIEPESLIRGFRDALAGEPSELTAEEMSSVLKSAGERIAAAQREERAAAAARNLEEGRAFLAENAKREGVRTLDSGLQYEVLEEGSGEQPHPAARVTVHYRGTLIDGTEFDSSYSRNAPSSFSLNGVIPGWKEALPMMKEGAKWKLFVPTQLAYAERGFGNKIPPNAALVFEVELISAREK